MTTAPTAASPATVALANHAIDVLRDRGWTVGEFENHYGQVCLLGALRIAAFGDPHLRVFHNVLHRRANRVYVDLTLRIESLLRRSGEDHTEIIDFNDYTAKSAHDVIALVRAAISGPCTCGRVGNLREDGDIHCLPCWTAAVLGAPLSDAEIADFLHAFAIPPTPSLR